MAVFQYRARTAAGAATNNPAWGLLTNATNAVKVKKLEIIIGSATASEYSLGIAAAAGTQTGGTAPQNVILGGTAGTSRIATAWSVNPTIPTQFVKGATFPATIGSMVYWYWEDGLFVPVSSELVLWNTGSGTNAAIQMFNVELEEL